jgi:hypothetical protein
VLWLHTTSGLESGVFGAAAALLAYLALFGKPSRRYDLAIFLLALLVGWLRSDGFVYLGILLAAAWIAASPSWKALAFGLLVSTGFLLLWRQLEFGAWLPNTAVAKVNFSLSTRLKAGGVLLLFALINSGLLVILLYGLAGLLTRPKRIRLAALFVLLAWVGYYLVIGGDTYFDRHLVGWFILAAALSAPLWMNARPPARILLVTVAVAGMLLAVVKDIGRFDYFHPKGPDPLILLGQALQADRPSYGVLIAGAAGKLPFFAGGDCLDPFGLNDPYLATLQRPQFTPGHSAGSDLAAIEIARDHPAGMYTTYSFLDPVLIRSPEDIRLWVDNRQPQESVQPTPSEAEWQAALQSGDFFRWSIISQPVTEK